MMLLYNSTCPPEYEPSGFHATREPSRIITDNTRPKIGSMDTGFHGYLHLSTYILRLRANLNRRVSVDSYKQDLQNRRQDLQASHQEIQNNQASQPSPKRRRFNLRNLSMSVSSETDGGATQEQGLRLLRDMVPSRYSSVTTRVY